MTLIYQNQLKMMMNKILIKKSLLFGLFILLLFMNGCGYRFAPQPDKDLMISDDYAIWKHNNFVFTVAEQMWVKDPQYLSDHYITFFVRIQNTSSETLTITKTQFAFLDENRNQTDASDPDDVLDIMMRDQSLYIDQFMVPLERQQEIQQKKSAIQRNLLSESLQFGEILPRASKQGYVFFPKTNQPMKKFTLVFKNKEIVFEQTK